MSEVTEAELIEKAKAPRVTKEMLDANIVKETFYQHGLLTICVLELANGFTVTGESACADPDNFDQDIGQRLARGQAESKVWPLMGYELKSKVALILGSRQATDPSFETYIGTKVVHAHPINRRDYNDFRGWSVPENEDPTDNGYIVEYADNANTPNTETFGGYVSWAPKDVFEASYHKIDYVKPTTTFLQRMEGELEDLVDKLTKLTAFFGTDVFNSLDEDNKVALQHQKHFMEGYADVLRLRIRYAKK